MGQKSDKKYKEKKKKSSFYLINWRTQLSIACG